MVITAQDTILKPGYKQTEVGMIPEDWELKPIGESFDICNHLRYPISQDVRKKMVGEYPYYGPTRAQDYINEYRVEGEYALIGEDGDHFLKWQESPMTLLVNGKFNVNNHAHLVKGTRNLTSWFYYYFQNKDLTPYLTRQGAGRYKLTKNTLITIPCPLPSPPEQLAIVTALCDVDVLITSLDRLIAKKRDIKQATMQQLLTGKTRLPGFSGEWQSFNMADNSTLKARIGWQGLTTAEYLKEGEYYLVTGTDFIDGKINWDSCHFVDAKRYDQDKNIQLRVGDVLLTKDGTIGKVAYINRLPGLATLNSGVFVIRPNNNKYYSLYLYYVLSSSIFDIFLKQLKAGSTISHLYQKDIVGFNFMSPSWEEQKAIAIILSDMDAEIAALEQKRDKTRALKQGMMQELLTGKTRLL
jgi:type I restriction enzyme, S subunit